MSASRSLKASTVTARTARAAIALHTADRLRGTAILIVNRPAP
ncbi:hypothetical protein ACFVXH_28640 [Kitasatospora sp. NPDC058184]